MGDNPLEPKAETVKPVDVLAAAAGVPTPSQVKGTWAFIRKHRKLAMLLGGLGLAATAGGYGIKYFRADPGKANAQPETPAVAAKPDEPKPAVPGFDDLPVVVPVKGESPAPDVPKIPDTALPPDFKLPDIKPLAPTGDKADVAPPLLPPGDKKKPADSAPDIAPPPIPDFKLPGDVAPPIKTPDTKKPEVEVPTLKLPAAPADKKKAAGDDLFKAPDLPPIDPKKVNPDAPPLALPSTVNEKKDQPRVTNPVIRVEGVQPPADGKKDDPKKTDVPALPAIPDISAPPVPGTDKKDPPVIIPPAGTDKKDPIIVPPPPPLGTDKKDPPVKDVTIPSVGGATVSGEKKVEPVLGPAPVDPLKLPDGPAVKAPDLKVPDGPPVPTINIDPPAIGSKAPPPATKKDAYYEDWHTWKAGDTYALISQEYYHDGKYAAALEAYNKEHRKPGDPIVRVPELWRLEEMYAGLVGKPADKPERLAPPEVKPAGGSGIKFEPVAPLPGSGRTPATPTSRSDEYKVTAEAGETIREVARKALGNPDAWRKLTTLNPDLDPTLPIPAGTVVRLPK